MHLNSIKHNSFKLVFKREFGKPISFDNIKVQVISSPKKVYQLKRIKSRLRVSFIGYSYNIKYYDNARS